MRIRKPNDAFNRVWTGLISRLQGEVWKLSAAAVAALRSGKYPRLLLP